MSNIILDNLGLGVAYNILRDRSNESSDILSETDAICWQQLLTAIVLWDNLYYLPDRGSISIGFTDYCKLGVNKLDGEWVFEEFYSIYSVKGEDSLSPFEFESQYFESLDAYAVASSLYCADVFLHPSRRADFELFDFAKTFNALKLLNLLDDEARKYVEKMNEELKMDIYLDIPFLYGYIRKNASTINDEFNIAKELRNKKEVVSFRKEIEGLKEANDLTRIYRAADHTKNVINEIMKNYEGAVKRAVKTKLSAQLAPKFNPEYGLIENLLLSASAKIEREWSYEPKVKSEFNFIFLEHITDYGLRRESTPLIV